MKKIILAFTALSLLWSCKEEKKEKTSEFDTEKKKEMVQFTPEIAENAIIYEANIRQYSQKGTFNEFTKDIPQLKELGVKIIWLMPVFPISETKRKATGGANSKFASEMPEAEQAKYLGSYYAVSDFKAINPEFGTIEDFRELVSTAHENDMYVILDWVPNHTGWDHIWIKEHPEFYTKNDKGEITHPKDTDWTDVADLDYSNQGLRKTMISDMKHWLQNEGVDGFRCDVAGSVPTDFWQEAIPQLRKEKNIFMLAEAWEPELLKDNLFDMCYAWDGHHAMNKMAQGKETVKEWDAYMAKRTKDYETDDILMNFVDNHDENSWNGTINERLGDASEIMMVLSYLTPGMPLIYSGDEYGLDHRLQFFEKDSIPKTKRKNWEIFKKLGELKINNIALNGGKNKASYKRIKTSMDDKILAFEREKDGKKIIFIGNLSKDNQNFSLELDGAFKNIYTNTNFSLNKNQNLQLDSWKFVVLQ
ncbi:Alpha-amlyase [Flavobacterium sp. 9AF]|uniref:alpha-amylase family glycosyl hydrolase n=1 Tax=Flavobacterium sp. 9AF TaxID=2653142 RepID=UPI0012F25BA5|nr:alpha-amylase family glycosyl hydrolase [Flavobacterium sp. 9AF]VXC26625.1 Alpha-amlyase [Flavobacterium sp. 9AF]